MNAKRLVALLMASISTLILSTVVSATYAYAYTKEGCKWPSATIKLMNNAAGAYHTRAQDAESYWNNADQPVIFQETGSLSVKFEVVDKNFGNVSYDGITNYSCSSGKFTSMSSYFNTYFTNGYSTNGKNQVMVHELGHALGLGHAGSSTCSGQQIMYYSSDRYFTCGHYLPQADDRNGANAIY